MAQPCDENDLAGPSWYDEFPELTRRATVRVHRRVATLRGQPVYSGFVEFPRSLTVFQARRVASETGESTFVAGDCYLNQFPIVRTVDQLELPDGSRRRIVAVDRWQDETIEPLDALQRVGFI